MRKKEDMHFRLLRAEKEAIEHAAKESNMTLSEYGRQVLLMAASYQKNNPEEPYQDIEKEKREVKSIRVTKGEWEYYQRQADIIGCSVSDYIRMSANQHTITVVPGIRELARQVAKIGVNLNQLTILAHEGRITEVDLFATKDSLKQILKQLNQLMKKGGD